jgi:adenylate cyclase
MIERDEAGTVARLKTDRQQFIDPTIAAHGGRIVRFAGDGALVEFPSAVEAAQCAIDIQRGMPERNAERGEDERIVFRMGVNTGDIIVEDDNLHGEGINVAARLESLCEPGGVLLSEEAVNYVSGKIDAGLEFVQERTVKNIKRPVRTWRVRLDQTPAAGQPAAVRRSTRPVGTAVLGLVWLLIAGIVGGWLWLQGDARIERAAMPDRPSIAVLAFENLSGDADQGFLADGIAEDITAELSRNPDLFVIARQSSFRFKGQNLPARKIARELGVRYVLEGSVRRAGNRLRINAQLVDGESGDHIWAERYDLNAGEIYEVQDRIIVNIAARLLSSMRETRKAAVLRRPPIDLDVYELTLRGIALKHRLTRESLIAGREALQRAIEMDPNFAPAHLYLGFLDAVDISFGNPTGYHGPEGIDVAIASIHRAIELDPNIPTAYQALSLALTTKGGQLEDALAAIQRAVELGPSDAENLLFLGRVQVRLGRYDEALARIDRAMALNPFAPAYYHSIRSAPLYALERFQDAVKSARACIALAPKYGKCRWVLAASLVALGKLDEAREQIDQLLDVAPKFSVETAIKVSPFVGDLETNNRYLAELRAAGLPEHPSSQSPG